MRTKRSVRNSQAKKHREHCSEQDAIKRTDVFSASFALVFNCLFESGHRLFSIKPVDKLRFTRYTRPRQCVPVRFLARRVGKLCPKYVLGYRLFSWPFPHSGHSESTASPPFQLLETFRGTQHTHTNQNSLLKRHLQSGNGSDKLIDQFSHFRHSLRNGPDVEPHVEPRDLQSVLEFGRRRILEVSIRARVRYANSGNW